MKRRAYHELADLIIHVPLALVVSPVVGIVLSSVAGFVLAPFARLLFAQPSPWFDAPYGPLIWGTGLLMGLLENRKLQSRSACWVGPACLMLMLLLMAWDVSGTKGVEHYNSTNGHYWRREYDELLSPSSGKCVDSECLGKLFFTTPVLTAVAYSVGAWLGLRSKGEPENSSPAVESKSTG